MRRAIISATEVQLCMTSTNIPNHVQSMRNTAHPVSPALKNGIRKKPKRDKVRQEMWSPCKHGI